MRGEVASSRLDKHQLIAVEKGLFELTRKQKSSPNVPVELSLPNFWASVGQLLHHLEMELAESIRNEGMTAKAQLQSRRLGVVRTSVTDLTRMRMNAFAQHAVLTNLMKGPGGDVMSAVNQIPALNWQKHDPSERIYHSGVGHLVEKYKHEVSWNALLHGGNEIPISAPSVGGNAPLSEFVDEGAENSSEVAPSISPNTSEVPVVVTPAVPEQPSVSADEDAYWNDPDFDEEDRIRQMDAFPNSPTGAISATSIESDSAQLDDSNLCRILILQDMDDPIIAEDGSEIHLIAGDIQSCPALIAETLIAAGLAESADL